MNQSSSRTRLTLVELIARSTELEPAQVTDDLDLVSLDLDSLDLTSMLIELEDELDIEIPIEILDQLFETGSLTTAALVRLVDGMCVTPGV